MKDKILQVYHNSSLATKIRYSYICLTVPLMFFLTFCLYNLWEVNRNYEDMINSTVVASEFSLDFKKEFDYETYLLIVENKTIEESKISTMLQEANRIVKGLEELTESDENINRLESVKKYLTNLDIYISRIESNLAEGNRYEDNMEIWENDVQIVTSLLRESIFQYIYYEVRDIQKSHEEYQNVFISMIKSSVLAFGLILCLILCLSYYIPLSITRPIRKLCGVTKQVAKGDLSVRANVCSGAEVNALNDSLNLMIDKMNELLEQVKKEQMRLRKAEFELLQSQINPHFLYNTLDAIIWLAESGEQEKVVHMVSSLSDFFRTSLNHGKDMITIKEELQHIRSYLEIQQVRYHDILHYDIQVSEKLEQFMIPKITIQPLVENALYHGIKNKRGAGHIVISSQIEKEYFLLQVKDDGIGISKERLEQITNKMKHKTSGGEEMYGLYNVNERISLNFGESYGIFIESVYGEYTIIRVKLPYVE